MKKFFLIIILAVFLVYSLWYHRANVYVGVKTYDMELNGKVVGNVKIEIGKMGFPKPYSREVFPWFVCISEFVGNYEIFDPSGEVVGKICWNSAKSGKISGIRGGFWNGDFWGAGRGYMLLEFGTDGPCGLEFGDEIKTHLKLLPQK